MSSITGWGVSKGVGDGRSPARTATRIDNTPWKGIMREDTSHVTMPYE